MDFRKDLMGNIWVEKLLRISSLHILRVTYSLYILEKKSFVAEGRSNRFHVFEGWLPAASLLFWFVVSLVDVYTASFRGTNGVQEPWFRVEKHPHGAGLFF